MRDSVLVQRVLDGDRTAGEQLVTEHYSRLYRLLRRLTNNANAAEDLTQQTFEKAWQALPGFQGQSSLVTWLHSIAYHEYTHWLRSRRNHTSLDDVVGVPDGRPPHELEGILVRDALDQLPPEHREAFVLYYVQRLSVPEVASVLSVPEGTIKSRLFTARRRLRELLREAQPDTSVCAGPAATQVGAAVTDEGGRQT